MLFDLFTGCTHARLVPETPVASMEYRVDNATRYPTLSFTLRRDDDGHFRLTNATGCDPEQAPDILLPDDSFAEQLRQIVIEEHMIAYKENYSSWRHRHVCGGSMWRFRLAFTDSETAVSSSGYMVYPEGNGLSRVEQLCRETWNRYYQAPRKDTDNPSLKQ